MNKPQPVIASWKGVVAIERPDTLAAHDALPTCRVMSARTMAGGMRAIVCRLPYVMVRDKFRAEDQDSVYHYAELVGDHLELRDRATQREFFLHPEQLSVPH